VDREGTIPGNAGTCVFCGVSLVGSPLYTNDGETTACGSPENAISRAGQLPRKTTEEDEDKEERNDYRETPKKSKRRFLRVQTVRLATVSERH
jgi:hypothetical protein